MPNKFANSGAQYRSFTCVRCDKGKNGNLREVNAWIKRHARFCKDMDEDERARTHAAAAAGMPNVTDRKAFKKSTKSTVDVAGGVYDDPVRAPVLPAPAPTISQHVLEGGGMTDSEFARMVAGEYPITYVPRRRKFEPAASPADVGTGALTDAEFEAMCKGLGLLRP